jgi:hypothetical protein
VYKTKLYGKYSNIGVGKLKYKGNKSNEEIIVRNFLKGLLTTPPLFNLSPDSFYGYGNIIEFIKEFDPSIKITPNMLAHLKQRRDEIKLIPVQKTSQSEAFVKYVKRKFKNFDAETFYRKSF